MFPVNIPPIDHQRDRENAATDPGYHEPDQDTAHGQHPQRGLHDLLRLQDDLPLRLLLRVGLLLLGPALARGGVDEPVRGLDVRERDEAQRDGQRRGRVGVRERGEREERLRVEHGRRLRGVREHHGRPDEDRELRDGRDQHRGLGPAPVQGEQLVPPTGELRRGESDKPASQPASQSVSQ